MSRGARTLWVSAVCAFLVLQLAAPGVESSKSARLPSWFLETTQDCLDNVDSGSKTVRSCSKNELTNPKASQDWNQRLSKFGKCIWKSKDNKRASKAAGNLVMCIYMGAKLPKGSL